jgi:hypothetical protein
VVRETTNSQRTMVDYSLRVADGVWDVGRLHYALHHSGVPLLIRLTSCDLDPAKSIVVAGTRAQEQPEFASFCRNRVSFPELLFWHMFRVCLGTVQRNQVVIVCTCSSATHVG